MFQPEPDHRCGWFHITWTNGTAPTHTATSDTNAWSTGNIAPGSTSGAIAFNTPGTLPYHCAIHPGMTGTIVVTAAATASASPAASRAPVVQRLAQGGGSPGLPIAAGLTLLGLGLLRLGRSRHSRPSR